MVATPVAFDLKTRYPEFNSVNDALVNALIGEAMSMIDDEWRAEDQKPAILAFAAHLLAMEGYPNRSGAVGVPIPPGAGREVTMRQVGDVTTQYAQSTSTGGGAGLLSSLTLTVYGRRFAQLLKLNAPAIGLV